MESPTWTPLSAFSARFEANLAALGATEPALASRLREHVPAETWWIAARENEVFLGRGAQHDIRVVPNPVPPAMAQKMLGALFPKGKVTWPVVLGGLGYGW